MERSHQMHRMLTIRAIQQAMVHPTAYSKHQIWSTYQHGCIVHYDIQRMYEALVDTFAEINMHHVTPALNQGVAVACCPCSGNAVLQLRREGVLQAPTVGVGVLAVAGFCCCECCRDGGYQSMLAAALAIKQEEWSACLPCCCCQEQ